MTAAECAAAIGAALGTSVIGRRLVVRERTGSTMEDARGIARGGASHGTVVLAFEQTAGRGRLGRTFVSPAGGLYMTLVLDPPGAPADAWRCGFAAAIAAREAIVDVGGPPVLFDWPNDLVLGDRKLGGFLMDLLQPADRGAPSAVLLLGIGINLGPDPAAVDAAAAGPAGPVPGLPPGDHRAAVAAGVLNRFEPLYARLAAPEGWTQVLDEVRRFARAAAGSRVSVRAADGRLVEGQGAGIREDGAILVRTDDGTVVTIRYGERIHRTNR